MIDIRVSQKPEDIDLVLHFVNKDMDPAKMPDIKKFTLLNDLSTKEFLKRFESVAQAASRFY